jgi:hypothetical protein
MVCLSKTRVVDGIAAPAAPATAQKQLIDFPDDIVLDMNAAME